MAVETTIAFATFFLENEYFVTFYEGFLDLANYFCSFDGRSADFNGTVGISEENTVKLYCVAFFYLLAEIMNIQEFVFFSFKLLSLNFYDNVHLMLYVLKVNPLRRRDLKGCRTLSYCLLRKI